MLRTAPFLLLLALLLGLSASACKTEPPAPWNEMHFPLGRGEILPGADADNLRVLYRNESRREDLFREFGRGLERAGYEYERDSKENDPAGTAFSTVFKKGSDRVLLTVTGGRDTNVELRRNFE